MVGFQNVAVLFSFIVLLSGSIILSFRTRFIQIRAIPRMFSLLWKSFFSTEHSNYTIKAHKALFTAMSTTIGMSNIIGPLVAIGFSGPGALIGYVLATIFGAASTFTEVTFALKYKDPAPLADRVGGPMHYLKKVFPTHIASLYAFMGTLLLIAWSGAQSNALATMLVPYHVQPAYTGVFLAVLTVFILLGGIKRVGAVAETLVPVMFVLYSSAMFWIIGSNADKLGATFRLIINGAFQPSALGGGIAIGALMHALRWGLAKGFTANESGLGTATVPHSMAEAENAVDQGILSVVSVFSNGILCLLSGIAILITNSHLAYGSDGIAVITNMFAHYFPYAGPLILLISTFLFVVSTIIGNSYNGSQFYQYLLGKRFLYVYHTLCAISIFASSIMPLNLVWEQIDILVAPIALIHIIGIVRLSFTHGEVLDDHLGSSQRT